MSRHNKIFLAVIFIVLLVAGVYALLAFRAIRNVGKIATVGISVWWDANCTQNCTEIDWDSLPPGENVSKVIFVRNEGTVPGNLSFVTQDWVFDNVPSNASEFLSLTWNYSGKIESQEIVPVTLTLSAKPEISGITNFSFTIVVKVEA